MMEFFEVDLTQREQKEWESLLVFRHLLGKLEACALAGTAQCV